AFAGAVDRGEIPKKIVRIDQIICVLKEVSVTLLIFSYGVLNPLSFGNVAGDALYRDGLVFLIDDTAVYLKRYLPTVLSGAFDLIRSTGIFTGQFSPDL